MNHSDSARVNSAQRQVSSTEPFCHVMIMTEFGECDSIYVRPHESCLAYGLRFVPDLTRSDYVRVGKEDSSEDDVRKHGFELRLDGSEMCIGKDGRIIDSASMRGARLHVTLYAYPPRQHEQEEQGELILFILL